MRQVIYDITRLATRSLRPTPNGIDRVDYGLSQHFLKSGRHAGLIFTLFGHQVLDGQRASRIVEDIGAHWGESRDPVDDLVYRKARAWLHDLKHGSQIPSRIRGRGLLTSDVLEVARRALTRGVAPRNVAPQNAIYLNVSQFPMWIGSYFNWLRKRTDIKPVFFIHDLLPLETPEFFPPAERQRHARRLDVLARLGAAAIVTSNATRAALRQEMRSRGRSDLPILCAPVPAAEIFTDVGGALPHCEDGSPYFVVCGTLEPRKNHLLLLHIWRELIRRRGSAAPKLILVGARGWENENAIDLLERSSTLSGHVLEVQGLSTPGLKRLLVGSCGLLMPSFAEGYGLPVVEALAANVPVVASNIEAFHNLGASQMKTISPLNGELWLDKILRLAELRPSERGPGSGQLGLSRENDWDHYIEEIEEFFESL